MQQREQQRSTTCSMPVSQRGRRVESMCDPHASVFAPCQYRRLASGDLGVGAADQSVPEVRPPPAWVPARTRRAASL